MRQREIKTTHQIRADLRERRERLELNRDGLIDLVAAYVPLSAPAVPAALTWAAIVEHYPDLLSIPIWAAVLIGLVAALAVESLGVLSVETALAMWAWNQRAAADDRAPLWLAVASAGVYLITVLLLVVLLKIRPEWAIGSLLPLSVLGALASVLAVSRKQHGERVYRAETAQADAGEVDRLTGEVNALGGRVRALQTENERLRTQINQAVNAQDITPPLTAPVTPSNGTGTANGGPVHTVTATPPEERTLTTDQRRIALLRLLQGIEDPDQINRTEIGERLGVTRQTIARDLDALQAAGRLTLNGAVDVAV